MPSSVAAVQGALERAREALSIRDLADATGYAPSTVRQALSDLQREGVPLHWAALIDARRVYALRRELVEPFIRQRDARRRAKVSRSDRRRNLRKLRQVDAETVYGTALRAYPKSHPWRTPGRAS